MRDYDDICACAVAYTKARDGMRLDDDLATYEAVLRSQIALADCLIAAGWTPPAAATDLLAMDRTLLAEPRGSMEAGPAE